ncbi:hypothetical protein [Vibrio phage BUCT006]|nr:hypothetical protein [Vibrio phage BUCT006]
MKTYKTYQECKIANPECEVVEIAQKAIDDFNTVYRFEPVVKSDNWSDGYEFLDGNSSPRIDDGYWKICHPSNHCMTVKEFLDAGYRFVDGDLIFSTTCSDKVVLVTNKTGMDRATYSISMANADSPSDNKRYILRAAALEKKPRTKVEYVKVEDSIWHLESDFKAGDLFAFDGQDNYVQVETEGDFTLSHSADNLYRRIETPMTEREAFIDGYDKLVEEFLEDETKVAGDWAGYVFDKLVN